MARRLTRDTKNAVLGGVAAGFANYFGVDPVLVWLAFILLVFLNGFGLLAYVVGWVIMPRAERTASAAGTAGAPAGAAGTVGATGATVGTAGGPGAPPGAPPVVDAAERIVEKVRQAGDRVADGLQRLPQDTGRGSASAGVVLIVLGVLFLLDRFSWWHWPHWARLSNLWPVILIAVGVSLILEAARGRDRKAS